MRRTAAKSSSVVGVGYDPRSKTLEIEFVSGDVYRYFDVPAEVHSDLLNSESKGRFFMAHIRDVYRFTKI
jgi:hypothetical protein